MNTCPNCSSLQSVMNGHSKGGGQRHLCRNCGFRFTDDTNFRKNDFYFTTKAIQLWLEGLNYAMIADVIGFTPETISRFIAPYKDALIPIRRDLTSIDDLKITRQNDLFIAIGRKEVNLPINGGGIIIVGHETEIWGISRKI